MSIFGKLKREFTPGEIVLLKVTRAPGEGHTGIYLDLDGHRFLVSPGDFSHALGSGVTVTAEYRGPVDDEPPKRAV